MGKYNFNYTAIQELKNENEKLKAENKQLREQSDDFNERIKRLEGLLEKNQSVSSARALIPMLDHEKYMELFGIKVGSDGAICKASNRTSACDIFTSFQTNIIRLLLPRVYIAKNYKPRILGKKLEDMTDEEYTIVVKTFQSIIDTLAYAKNKINNGKENKNERT